MTKSINKNRNIEHKYNIIIEDCSNGQIPFDTPVRTVDSKGRPIGEYIYQIRKAFKQGKLDLPEDKIDLLKQLKILPKQEANYDELTKEYGISPVVINRIFRYYDSIESFILNYKNSINFSRESMNYYNIKDLNAILLSSQDTTVKDKAGYVRFVMAAFGIHNLNGLFINKEYIDGVLDSLLDFERLVIESIYGLNGKTSTSTTKLSKSIKHGIKEINSILKKAHASLLQKSTCFNLEDLKREKNRLQTAFERITEQDNPDLYDQLAKRIQTIDSLLTECNRALNRFMEDENIFDENGIVPASGISHINFSLDSDNLYLRGINHIFSSQTYQPKSYLRLQAQEKRDKEKELAQLQTSIDMQKVKERKLNKKLGIKDKDK